MSDDYEYAIPAASMGDADLDAVARSNSDAAKEIARLEGLMNRGEETKDEFFCLCQLLFEVGSVAAAEILLHRNLDYYEGEALYTKLFGTEKQDEFAAAIQAFESQFKIQLSRTESNDFLVSTFHSVGGPPRSDNFELLAQPCEIKIGYIEQDKIEADIVLLYPEREELDADEFLPLFHRLLCAWLLAPRDAVSCKVNREIVLGEWFAVIDRKIDDRNIQSASLFASFGRQFFGRQILGGCLPFQVIFDHRFSSPGSQRHGSMRLRSQTRFESSRGVSFSLDLSAVVAFGMIWRASTMVTDVTSLLGGEPSDAVKHVT